MKFYSHTIASTACLLSLVTSTPAITKSDAAPTTTPAKKGPGNSDSQQVILNAIKDLEAVRKHLNATEQDLSAHTDNPLEACDEAIKKLKEAEKLGDH